MTTKNEVLREHLRVWLEARGDRKKRKEITAIVCASLKMHPKSVPRAMRRIQMQDPTHAPRKGRRTVYGPDVTAALLDVWEVGDRCCGELLHPMVAEYVEAYRTDKKWMHAPETTRHLLEMSERTMKRRVRELARKHGGYGRGKTTTKPSSMKSVIPIFKGPWKDVLPGNGQVDTVAHCGDTLKGDFVFSVNFTDVSTYWTVLAAQWNKGQRATVASMERIRSALPFPMLGAHPDSGSEFINRLLKGWCDERSVELTRSEPGKKNDNMCVEERNGHVVRRYLGYVRYDNQETVAVINELYDVLALYLNHFKAVKRCISKERVGAKYVRRYETVAKTPYQRVLEHPSISDDVKERLHIQHASLSPLRLKQQVDTLIQKVYKLQSATRNERR